MAKTDFKSVAEYIAAQPQATASTLVKVRSVLKKALPKAEEGISYQIPTYKLGGRAVLYFAGYKKHFSLYPATQAVLDALGEAGKTHLVSKGTLRFELDEPFPAKWLERAAKARAAEVTNEIESKTKRASAPQRTARANQATKTAKQKPGARKKRAAGSAAKRKRATRT